MGFSSTRSHAVAEDRLVSEERVLRPGLTMVAHFLLPLPSTDLANPANGSIPNRRSIASDLRVLDGRDHDLRTPARCSRVEGSRVVGRVADDRVDLIGHLIEERDARGGVIDIRVGQRLNDDDSC